jgi:hypothetical protein
LALPAPKPVDALRQHTRAVVLISAEGDAAPTLLDAIRDSEVPCQLIGHPLVAMAELIRLEQDNRQGSAERTALIVADDERIDQLDSLFHAVRVRLPRVAIWVIAGDFAVQVQRATAGESAAPSGGARESSGGARDPSGGAREPLRTNRRAPQLRIVDHSDEPAPLTTDVVEIDDDLPSTEVEKRHSTALTAEELDMLLGWEDGDPDGADPIKPTDKSSEKPGGRPFGGHRPGDRPGDRP